MLIQDVYNNLNNDELKTTVDKKAYDLKNAKNLLVKITTKKISEKNAHELYSDLITPDITALEKSKSKGKDRRNSIVSVLKNLESAFISVYLNYSDKPSESEQSVAEKTKLRRQRTDKIAEKGKMIYSESYRECLEYSSTNVMYNNLNQTIGSEKNKAQVNAIKDELANMMEAVKVKGSDAKKKKI